MMNRARRRLLGFLALGAFSVGISRGGSAAEAAEPVRVVAAVTLKPALDEIAARYGERGSPVALVYGPSPILAKQIENGLPADVFFSADALWVTELEQHGRVAPGSVSDVVGNTLVVIGRNGASPLGMLSARSPLLRLVGAGPLAMCDPDSHPAGRYAKAGLETLGLWAGIAGKIARAENPLRAVEMVATGDVPLAIVFATDARTDDRVAVIATFPDNSHPPIRYPVAIITGPHEKAGRQFVDYLRSETAVAVFQRLGYTIAGGSGVVGIRG